MKHPNPNAAYLNYTISEKTIDHGQAVDPDPTGKFYPVSCSHGYHFDRFEDYAAHWEAQHRFETIKEERY